MGHGTHDGSDAKGPEGVTYFDNITVAQQKVKAFEGLDNRKLLWQLIDRLGEGASVDDGRKRRIRFLAWCCHRVDGKIGTDVKVDYAKTVGDTKEIYQDIIHMVFQLGLDIVDAVLELERRIRVGHGDRKRLIIA